MSEKTIRSGIWSGVSLASTAASRMRSHARAKLVLPPHGASRVARTFATMPRCDERSTQRGLASNVSTRCANPGSLSSETRMPSAIATSIGVPAMLPETSTSATSLPRSMRLGARATQSSAPSPTQSATRSAATLASCSRTEARRDSHCASSTSTSAAERVLRPFFIASRAISCGCSAAPCSCNPPGRPAILRSFLRASTRSASSGKRSPVSKSASVSLPFTRSFKNALRLRFKHSAGTRSKASSE
mmetsp:Transcript_11054/g.34907  ORF Transcript_11054/g.34907 Transcript_11054/m.34907 type:complete len:246 (+) Transcript_11054:1396-2133(+)